MPLPVSFNRTYVDTSHTQQPLVCASNNSGLRVTEGQRFELLQLLTGLHPLAVAFRVRGGPPDALARELDHVASGQENSSLQKNGSLLIPCRRQNGSLPPRHAFPLCFRGRARLKTRARKLGNRWRVQGGRAYTPRPSRRPVTARESATNRHAPSTASFGAALCTAL